MHDCPGRQRPRLGLRLSYLLDYRGADDGIAFRRRFRQLWVVRQLLELAAEHQRVQGGVVGGEAHVADSQRQQALFVITLIGFRLVHKLNQLPEAPLCHTRQ